MDCREVCARIEDFFHERLPVRELEPFVEHIQSCQACREELQVYVTVDVGLALLEEDASGAYDPEGAYDACMERSCEKMDWYLAWRSFRYAITTIAFWFVVFALLLQIKTIL